MSKKTTPAEKPTSIKNAVNAENAKTEAADANNAGAQQAATAELAKDNAATTKAAEGTETLTDQNTGESTSQATSESFDTNNRGSGDPGGANVQKRVVVVVDGGEEIDVSTDEGKEKVSRLLEAAHAEDKVPQVSINGAPALPADSPELQKQFEALERGEGEGPTAAEDAEKFKATDEATNEANQNPGTPPNDAVLKNHLDSTTVTNAETGETEKSYSPENPNETFTESNLEKQAAQAEAGEDKPRTKPAVENPNAKFTENFKD